MLKNNLVKINQTKSIFLLLVATIILAIFIGFDKFSTSNMSTGFNNIHGFYFFKNKLVDSLLQLFGISIYLIPIILLIWSYKLFFNQRINNITFRIVLMLICLFIFPLLCNNFLGANNGGILGAYLNYNLNSMHNYYFIILIIGILFLGFISNISLQDIYITTKIISYFINSLLILSINYLTIFKNFLSARFHFSIGSSAYNKKSNNPKSLSLDGIINNLEDEEIKEHTNFINHHNTNQALEVTPNDFAQTNNYNQQNTLLPHHANYKGIHSSNTESKSDEADLILNTAEAESNNEINQLIDTIKTPQTHSKPAVTEDSAVTMKKARATNSTAFTNNFTDYHLPTSLLDSKEEKATTNNQEIKSTALKLESVIREFGIEGKIVNIQTGPVVTLFEIAIPPGVKTSKLISLEADISLRMKAFSVRIAIVPGKDVIGIEIPNTKRQTVYLRKLLENKSFIETQFALPMNLGFDISGKAVLADLATMPHLLVAGTTGSGKSVAVNAMILSLLYKLSPDQCKMIMIDPKMLELSIYQDIPHLLTPVVTDSKKAIYALKWAVKQMEYRYSLMSHLGVRNINGYNEKLKDTKSVEDITERLRVISQIDVEFEYMPYIVIIIDEMADLMLVAGKEIEAAVQRLAQMARAAGIHLIMATQRPSVDVITGTIKANFPTRISFQVSSKIDSRTILGEQGAERLLGRGDMLYMMGVGRIQRVHGPFVSDVEVEKIVTLLRKLGSPKYIEDVTKEEDNGSGDSMSEQGDYDDLYNEVIDLIKQEGKISTSYIQRRFQIGYNRAARIVDMLEQNGVISKATATGKREILIN
ncbi:DNA translocase FtsK [Rickettsiales bacterium LUAb2]